MSDVMRSILSRVLTEEVAQQETWKKKELEDGFDSDRDGIIDEIRQFMTDNDIPVYQL